MKIYAIIGTIIGVALLAFGLWKLTDAPKAPQPQENIATTTPLITVNPIQPQVSISKEPNSFFTQISDVEKVNPGATVKTGSSGRALVDSSSAHRTVIDYNSEVVIKDDSQEEKKTRIALITGAVWSRLEKVFDSGEYYEVKTSNAVATVRGTSFGVWYSNLTTTIVVTEGSIFVSAVDPKTGEVIPGTEVTVEAGNKAIVTADGTITVSKIASSDRSSAWYIYNNPGTVSTPTPKTPQVQVSTTPTATTTQNTSPTPPPVTTPPTTPFTITSVFPTTIQSSANNYITVKGDGFHRLKTLIVGRNSLTNYTIISPTSLRFPTDQINPGTYTITLIDINNYVAQSSTQVTITAPEEVPAETFYPNTFNQ